jgi:hypothetical protein
MKNKLLLPRKCRLVGAILLPFAFTWLIAGYFGQYSVFPFLKYNMKSAKGDLFPPDFILSKNFYTDFNGELSLLITLVCLFMIAFSREKVEDEYVRIIRLRALQISVYTSYLIFAVASIFIYGVSFLYVMFANVFTVLFIFIVVFYYNLHIKSGISKSQAA